MYIMSSKRAEQFSDFHNVVHAKWEHSYRPRLGQWTIEAQTVSQAEQQARPSQWSGWCKTQKAQRWELVDRAEPEMGDCLPSQSLVV